MQIEEKIKAQTEEILKAVPKADKTVLDFITELTAGSARSEEEYEVMRSTFRAGYCWHFAHLLKDTFGRGEVCWAAPFGHFVWVDENGVPYDAEGVNFGEQAYHIPESYLGDMLDDFRHIPGRTFNASVSEIMTVIRRYEDDRKLPHKDLQRYLEEGPMKAWKITWHASGFTGSFACKVVAPSGERASRLVKEYVKGLQREAQYAWERAKHAMEVHYGGYISGKELDETSEEEGCYPMSYEAWNISSDHLRD